MNCPHCGKEILDEDATFCPKCGKPLEIKPKQTDYVVVAAILTIIAATFSAGLGYNAIYRYVTFVPLYDFLLVFGFLFFGIVNIVASTFAMAGATFMLKRKFVMFSMLGVILLLVSALITNVIVYTYRYGFTDIIVFSEIPIIVFPILSAILVFISKKEFT